MSHEDSGTGQTPERDTGQEQQGGCTRTRPPGRINKPAKSGDLFYSEPTRTRTRTTKCRMGGSAQKPSDVLAGGLIEPGTQHQSSALQRDASPLFHVRVRFRSSKLENGLSSKPV